MTDNETMKELFPYKDNRERKCGECIHYVVKDVKHNYCQNGCGTYDQYIYGCERWDCEFKEKGKVGGREEGGKITLDEAIEYEESIAEKHRQRAEKHRQLAEWLKELKAYREREQKAIRNRCPMV